MGYMQEKSQIRLIAARAAGGRRVQMFGPRAYSALEAMPRILKGALPRSAS